MDRVLINFCLLHGGQYTSFCHLFIIQPLCSSFFILHLLLFNILVIQVDNHWRVVATFEGHNKKKEAYLYKYHLFRDSNEIGKCENLISVK